MTATEIIAATTKQLVDRRDMLEDQPAQGETGELRRVNMELDNRSMERQGGRFAVLIGYPANDSDAQAVVNFENDNGWLYN